MILVTGNNGYIGVVMTKLLMESSYEVKGVDINYYKGCEFSPQMVYPTKQIVKDIRDIDERDLEGVTAVIHLAALSNDPLGEINPNLTYEINYLASVKLASLCKKVGVERFIFASSCSIYGRRSDNKPVTEEDKINPLTTYAKTKIMAEKEISKLADESFHPTFMRNATVYGASPNLRLDLVVNNLVAWAYLTGKINIMSDGTPWRPIIHVEDFCGAFLAVLEAPIEKIHNQVFNVGINEENYQIKDIGEEIARVVPNCEVRILNKTGPDERSYCVNFSKIKQTLPEFNPKWNLRRGVEELYEAYKKFRLSLDGFNSSKYFRVRWIKNLIDIGRLNSELKWTPKEK